MRDPQRIEPLLATLRTVWEQNPDMRLGQLLMNAAVPAISCPALFYLEDDALLAALERSTESK